MRGFWSRGRYRAGLRHMQWYAAQERVVSNQVGRDVDRGLVRQVAAPGSGMVFKAGTLWQSRGDRSAHR